MTPEGKVKSAIRLYLRTLGSRVKFWCIQDRYTSGILDILGCCDGRFFAIEVKAPGQKPRLLQRIEITSIRKAGGAVISADNVDDVKIFMMGVNGGKTQ